MDLIDEVLATNSISSDYCQAIQAALLLGKRTVNRYYSKTDDSEIYRIAMGTFLLLAAQHQRSRPNTDSLVQFFILATSSSTFEMQNGARNGLGWQR